MRKRTAAAPGSQALMIDVVSVKPMGGYRLRVAFSDGSSGVHDFSSTTARDGEMARPLKDPAFFARVFVELGALTCRTDTILIRSRFTTAWRLQANLAVRRRSSTGTPHSLLDNSISTWLTCDMNVKLRQIEFDEETAALLGARAGARGMMGLRAARRYRLQSRGVAG